MWLLAAEKRQQEDVKRKELCDCRRQKSEESIVDAPSIGIPVTVMVMGSNSDADKNAADGCEDERKGGWSSLVFPESIPEVRERNLTKGNVNGFC